MTANPFLIPTRARLALADGIEARQVVHYAFRDPFSVWKANLSERVVTARVAELVRAGLAEYGSYVGDAKRRVDLTDAGRAWKAAARADA